MNSTVYVIVGDPIPLARARHIHNRVYDSQKALKLINGITLRAQHNDRPLLSGPLHLNVQFYMPIAATSRKKAFYHVFKPDLDNLIKWICDISNSILFNDDCIVAKITATKMYDKNPRTEFTLEVLE